MSAHVTTDGYTFLVDDADDALLVGLNCWTLPGTGNTRYVQVWIPQQKILTSLHRLIAGINGLDVDHRDGDGLNNRRLNLRPANESQNGANRGISKNNSSGFKGVSIRKSSFLVHIQVLGKKMHVGCYRTPREAALAYDIAATKHFGEFARTNKMLGLV